MNFNPQPPNPNYYRRIRIYLTFLPVVCKKNCSAEVQHTRKSWLYQHDTSFPQEGHVPIANATRPYRQRDASLFLLDASML